MSKSDERIGAQLSDIGAQIPEGLDPDKFGRDVDILDISIKAAEIEALKRAEAEARKGKSFDRWVAVIGAVAAVVATVVALLAYFGVMPVG